MGKRKATETTVASEATVDSSSSSSSSSGRYTNKQRVLVIASRGITARYRHLLEDLKKLIPHHKKDSKLDDKGDIQAVNEIAEMKSCNQVIFLETRKHQDLYMYIGKTPQGPSAKFHVVNIHTMDELKLTGNCMIGSRPLLNFDSAFDGKPHFQLMKQMLADAFGTPLGHPKSKPFNDRVMSFFIIKNNIWVRNYQIAEKTEGSVGSSEQDTHLVEIGPRFVLIPIRIFNGSLGGVTLYQNQAFVSPNEERSMYKKQKGDRYVERVAHNAERRDMAIANKLPPDLLSSKNVFADD
jgi:ribosome biogenesis protein BRX1